MTCHNQMLAVIQRHTLVINTHLCIHKINKWNIMTCCIADSSKERLRLMRSFASFLIPFQRDAYNTIGTAYNAQQRSHDSGVDKMLHSDNTLAMSVAVKNDEIHRT